MSGSLPADVIARLRLGATVSARRQRFYLRSEHVLTARFTSLSGSTVDVTDVMFRAQRADGSPWQAGGRPTATAGEWGAVVPLDLAGTWRLWVECGRPLRKLDEISADVIASGADAGPTWAMQLDFSDPHNSGLLFLFFL